MLNNLHGLPETIQKLKTGIIIHDSSGKITKYNQAAVDILGTEPTKLINHLSYISSNHCFNEYNQIISLEDHPVSITLKTHNEVHGFLMGMEQANKKISWISVDSFPIINGDSFEGVLVAFESQTNLKLYQDRLRLALSHSNIGVWDWDLNDNSLFLSSTWKTQLGYRDSEIENSMESFQSLLHPKDINKVLSYAQDFIDNKISNFNIRFRLKNKHNSYVWIESSGNLIKDPNGKPIRFIGVHQNINENLKDEIKLRQSATIFDSAHDSIMITDQNNMIISVNKAFEETTGYKSDEVVGKSPRILRSGKHDEGFYSNLWYTLENDGAWDGEIWNKTKSGTIYPEWLSIKVNTDTNGNIQNYIAIFSDMSEIKSYQKQLQFEINHDSLTKLYNRKKFYEDLEYSLIQASRTHSKIALTCIDIKNFKFINDTYGHDNGDKVLIQIAERLRSLFRESDFVARLGGDEFGCVLNHLEHEYEIEILLNRIIDTIKKPIKLSNTITLYLDLAIGVALFPDNGANVSTLIKYADIAMYKAKKSDNIFCFYDDDFTQFHINQLELLESLKSTLKAKNIDVVYQPQIDIETGIVSCIEALARWDDPQKGDISPSTFVKLCEDFGLVEELNDIVFEGALKDLKEFQHNGYVGKLALNISAKLLKHRKTIVKIRDLVYKYDINPAFIELEITETAIIENMDLAVEIIDELRSIGFFIAIDDFGTGYTSLIHLQQLNVNTLKIDKKFIDNIVTNEKDQILVKTMIQLSQSMNLNVIIEGIENKEQIEYLSQFNCHEFQGYYFSKPLNHKDLSIYLAKNTNYTHIYNAILEKVKQPLKDKEIPQKELLDIEELTLALKSQYKELQHQTNQLNASKLQYQKIYDEFKTLFDLAPVGYAIVNQQMHIENSNNYFDQLTKKTDHKFINLYFDAQSKNKFIQWFEKLDIAHVHSIRLGLEECSKIVQLYGRVFTHRKHKSYFISMIDITEENDKTIKLQKLNTKLNEMVQEEIDKNVQFQEQYINDKIESSRLAIIGQMASGLTHEINTPLTIIRGNLQLIQEDIKDIENIKIQDIIKDDLNKAYYGVDRIAYIVNSLRELSDQDPRPQKTNLYSTIIASLSISYIRHKHICPILLQNEIFKIDLDKEKYQFFTKATPRRLEQVWINIINNSLDELIKKEDHSRRKLIIDIEEDEKFIIVSIQDNGGGIPEKVLSKIFKPFVSTKSSSGIGLGMFITKKIIEEYGGYIKISNNNGGAITTVGLPKA